MSNSKPFPERFYLLDIFRGVTALAVVLYHYKNFYFETPETLYKDYSVSQHPFSGPLSIIYDHGILAVPLFFVLSGFVFFYLYAKSINDGSVSSGRFFLLRFSRLYPLHIITLIVVAALQIVSSMSLGEFLIYPHNDIKHFVLHLFMVNEWGMNDGSSFNAPAWSISVEVYLYILFFIFSMFVSRRFIGALFIVLLCLAISFVSEGALNAFSRSVMHFFSGGLAFLVYQETRRWPLQKRNMLLLAVFPFAASSLLFMLSYLGEFKYTVKIFLTFVVPACIFLLAHLQDYWQQVGHSLRLIGDISYSVYLWHVPLQILGLLIIRRYGLDVDFSSAWTLMIYFTASIAVSMLSYYHFEIPMQKRIRQAYRVKRQPLPAE